MYYKLLVLFGLVLLSAVFSGSEIALISLTKSKVDALATKGVRGSKILQKLKSDPPKLLITILIGNNLVNIFASAYAAVVFTEIFGSSGVGIATGVMTFFILVFGEITPKSFAHQHAARVSLWMARPIYLLKIILFPFVWIFNKIAVFANQLTGLKKGASVTEGEIVAMLRIGAKEGAIEKQERELIENVLEFNDIEVEEVMTPRIAIEALDADMTLKQAVEFSIKHSHSRLPVYKGSIDHIIGVISIKELLRHFDEDSSNKKLKKLDLQIPLEVPLSKKINHLFGEFQRKHKHIAIVVDAHGGIAGLVTMEDLLEEIVGDIVDETDIADKPIEILDAKTVIASGFCLIEDINDFFKIKIEANERDTINMLLAAYLHRFPRQNEVVMLPLINITILSMTKNIVEKVKIQKRKAAKH